MAEPIILSVGDDCQLKRGKDRIAYAGMLSNDIYSIIHIKRAAFDVPMAWNLYYPKRQNEITVNEVKVAVDNVTPEQITLRVK